jgi:hypothetical protein
MTGGSQYVRQVNTTWRDQLVSTWWKSTTAWYRGLPQSPDSRRVKRSSVVVLIWKEMCEESQWRIEFENNRVKNQIWKVTWEELQWRS